MHALLEILTCSTFITNIHVLHGGKVHGSLINEETLFHQQASSTTGHLRPLFVLSEIPEPHWSIPSHVKGIPYCDWRMVEAPSENGEGFVNKFA